MPIIGRIRIALRDWLNQPSPQEASLTNAAQRKIDDLVAQHRRRAWEDWYPAEHARGLVLAVMHAMSADDQATWQAIRLRRRRAKQSAATPSRDEGSLSVLAREVPVSGKVGEVQQSLCIDCVAGLIAPRFEVGRTHVRLDGPSAAVLDALKLLARFGFPRLEGGVPSAGGEE